MRALQEKIKYLHPLVRYIYQAREKMMQQLLYISSVTPSFASEMDKNKILSVSRINNARDDISGLLFFNGKRFLQALEGSDTQVQSTFERIKADPRHRGIVVLSSRDVDDREFGAWAMACEAHDAPSGNNTLSQISRLVENASWSVRGTFESFANYHPAA